MTDTTSLNKPIKISMLAFDDISAFHLSVPCLVFRDAAINSAPEFDLQVCTQEPGHIVTSSGFKAQIEHDLAVMNDAEIILIPSWPNHLPEPSKVLLDTLKRQHRRGALLVGLCLGSYVLACAGLLDGKKVTTHWGFADHFKKKFPKVEVDADPLFIEYDKIITSAGTAASLDCCLHIVRRFCGSEYANELARVMVTAPFRSGGQKQYIPVPIYDTTQTETSMSKVIEDIAEHLTERHSLEHTAQRCAMSTRTFTRQFKATYGCTFGDWLLNHRLVLSQRLLETTQSSVTQVAELSGFGSESVFRKQFKRTFQVSPSQWRATFKQSI